MLRIILLAKTTIKNITQIVGNLWKCKREKKNSLLDTFVQNCLTIFNKPIDFYTKHEKHHFILGPKDAILPLLSLDYFVYKFSIINVFFFNVYHLIDWKNGDYCRHWIM